MLGSETPLAWVEAVEGDLLRFLQDHAMNERKVAVSALTLAVQHPQHQELVGELIAVAREELEHFQRLYRVLVERGSGLAQDYPDPYIKGLQKAARRPGVDEYLLDRLVIFAVIEARACERFGLLARHLQDEKLRQLYQELARAEARHRHLYLDLAERYFAPTEVAARADEIVSLEAELLRQRPLRPALY